MVGIAVLVDEQQQDTDEHSQGEYTAPAAGRRCAVDVEGTGQHNLRRRDQDEQLVRREHGFRRRGPQSRSG